VTERDLARDPNSPPCWYREPAPDGAVDRLVGAFREAFGTAPEGVWSAPGRVNLIGEHVDYHGGLVLPFALPHRTWVAARRRDDGLLRLHTRQGPGGGPDEWQGALDAVAPGTVTGWPAYPAGVVWALLTADDHDPADDHGPTKGGTHTGPAHDRPRNGSRFGLDLAVDSAVPLGAGLSSSAALECAVALAVDDLCGLGLAGTDAGRAVLAAACVRAENEIAAAPTGGMDQAVSLRARAGHALLLDCRTHQVEHVPLPLDATELAVLVIDTRVHHMLGDGRYGARRRVAEEAAALLDVPLLGVLAPAIGGRETTSDDERTTPGAGTTPGDGAPAWVNDVLARLPEPSRPAVRHVLTETARVAEVAGLLRAGQAERIGPALSASHASLRDDYLVSCAELDLACRCAEDAGALGARMTGGGFGGSAIALVHTRDLVRVAQAVTDGFARAGSAAPGFVRATAAGPARRDR